MLYTSVQRHVTLCRPYQPVNLSQVTLFSRSDPSKRPQKWFLHSSQRSSGSDSHRKVFGLDETKIGAFELGSTIVAYDLEVVLAEEVWHRLRDLHQADILANASSSAVTELWVGTKCQR